MKTRFWLALALVLGGAILLALLYSRNSRKKPTAATEDAVKKLEATSGLRTNELSISVHTLWQDEGEKPIVIELNAGPECAKTTCSVTLEASDRAKGQFRALGELYDAGESGDRQAHDGIYSRKIL